MSAFSFLGFGGGVSDELPDIFPLTINQRDFVEIDVVNIYSKILIDIAERTEGLTDEMQVLLWDNCLQSEKCDGLVTLLAKAMSCKEDLFIVYDKAVKIVRKATGAEQSQIKKDYEKQAASTVGVYVSFKNYLKSDMLKIYSALEFCTVGSMYKSANVAKAVQIKINELRASVSLGDSAVAKAQAQAVAKALKSGRDVLLDAKDEIVTAAPDTTAAEKSMALFNQKRAFYLGLPASYITGELNSGLGDSGQADSKAVDRGLKPYFISIFKPVCSALFGVQSLTYKSEDFQMLESALEAMKTFDITSAQFMSDENKLIIVNKLFGMPPDTKGGPAPEEPDPLEQSNPKQDPNKDAPPTAVPPKGAY